MIATILEVLKNRAETLATAESCTGGRIASAITGISGASAVFRGGIVAYHEDIKESVLNVDKRILSECHVVSRETALAMAAGATRISQSDWAIATTGYAGPGGGDDKYPVGTVCFGVYSPKYAFALTVTERFEGDRESVIRQATIFALDLLLNSIQSRNC